MRLCSGLALFIPILSNPNSVKYRHIVLLFLVIFFVAMLKITHALLWLPFFYILRGRFGINLLQSLLLPLFLIGGLFFFVSYTSAPYPWGYISNLKSDFSNSFAMGVQSILQHAYQETVNFFNHKSNKLEVSQRAQLFFIIVISVFSIIRKWKYEPQSVLIFFITMTTLMVVILLYDVSSWRDYRVFAPIILLCAFLFIMYKQYVAIYFILITNIVISPVFFQTYQTYRSQNFSENINNIIEFEQQIKEFVYFDKKRDGWGNTLLLPLGVVLQPLLGVPSGIGLTVFSSLESGVKSRYLLLDEKNANLMRQRVELRFLTRTTLGDLYENISLKK